MKSVDLIIPVYNEAPEVVQETVRTAQTAFAANRDIALKIIVVDDGSKQALPEAVFSGLDSVILVRHRTNQGYGAALKTGIRTGKAPWIAIADADGTYPVASFPGLVAEMEHYDTVVGVRTGKDVNIPFVRRFPKKLLNVFASYLANTRIVDLNSGMRVFTRDLAEYLRPMFPSGFSFTSTLTMGSYSGGFRVLEMPIDYHRRKGTSSIRPVRDTIRFFRLAMRLGLLFAPMRIFTPVALVLMTVGAWKGFAIDYPNQHIVGNLAVALMIGSIQVFMMGVLGKLIVLSRSLARR